MHTRYDDQKTLSDIAGWDIGAHGGDHIKAVREVRNWLIRQTGAGGAGSTRILLNYATFQDWYWRRERANGSSDDDILAYPTVQMVSAMREWVDGGRPV